MGEHEREMAFLTLADAQVELRVRAARVQALKKALEVVAMAGTTRPLAMGEGDDGDGHWRRIACALIACAARALAGEGDK